ncbi:MAG TPA: hypothetical protein VMD59_14840 [Acidimicrobiales bacterium]|nr:hypothetical protein [Acidimicrobiales bacterium]
MGGVGAEANPAHAASAHRASPAMACSICGHNLIANPGAEAGRGTDSDSVVKVPDWKATGAFTAAQYAWGGGDLSATTKGPKDRGKNYFYGGPSALESTGTQIVDLAAAPRPGTTYVLAGWLGGYADQGDHCQLSATFETATGKNLGVAKIGPVTASQRHDTSELLYRGVGGKVPTGTHRVVLTMLMVLETGGDNDGMADNLSLVFTAPK